MEYELPIVGAKVVVECRRVKPASSKRRIVISKNDFIHPILIYRFGKVLKEKGNIDAAISNFSQASKDYSWSCYEWFDTLWEYGKKPCE